MHKTVHLPIIAIPAVSCSNIEQFMDFEEPEIRNPLQDIGKAVSISIGSITANSSLIECEGIYMKFATEIVQSGYPALAESVKGAFSADSEKIIADHARVAGQFDAIRRPTHTTSVRFIPSISRVRSSCISEQSGTVLVLKQVELNNI